MKYDLDTLRGDVFGGLTSAVVALPVSLAFVGAGGGRRAVRRHCGGVLCRGVRRHAVADLRPHGADGGDHHQPLIQPVRGAHRGDDGRPAAGAPGRDAGRALRGLYAARGGVRVHVGHRRHRDADPDPAVSGRAHGAGRAARYASRAAVRLGRCQHQRLCHCPGDAPGRRAVAAQVDQVHAGTAGSLDRRHAARRAGAA